MSEDGALPIAKRRLSDCVHALADPQPQWVDGVCRWQGSVYDRLRVELAGTAATQRRQVHASRLPCHSGILALLVEVDGVVRSWDPDGKDTTSRLHALVDRGWRPQDCEVLDGYVATIERWVLAGTELLAPVPVVYLRQPCPRCGQQFTHRRDSAGELVNVRALKVSENGCTCLGRGASWPPERFHFLAALLGCAPLPA